MVQLIIGLLVLFYRGLWTCQNHVQKLLFSLDRLQCLLFGIPGMSGRSRKSRNHCVLFPELKNGDFFAALWSVQLCIVNTRVENGNSTTVTVRYQRIQYRMAQGRAAYCCTKVLKSQKGTLVDECSLESAGYCHMNNRIMSLEDRYCWKDMQIRRIGKTHFPPESLYLNLHMELYL